MKAEKANRQITSIKMDEESVTIKFAHIIAVEKGNGTDDEEDDGSVITNQHAVTSQNRPHKDFSDAMKVLRRHALDVCEIELAAKGVIEWNVSAISISGDLLLRQSRVVMTLSKFVKRTNKTISFKTPQVTMYGESEYPKAEELSKLIEKVLKEAWLYVEGKYSEESEGQLALFSFAELQPA